LLLFFQKKKILPSCASPDLGSYNSGN